MISLIPDKELAAKFNGKYAYMYAMYPNSSFWKSLRTILLGILKR